VEEEKEVESEYLSLIRATVVDSATQRLTRKASGAPFCRASSLLGFRLLLSVLPYSGDRAANEELRIKARVMGGGVAAS
jgi:hypothetical protein